MTASTGNVPHKMQEKYEAVVSITDSFCLEYLDEHYAALSRNMAASLSRKRPSPLQSGRPVSWAAGIIYALGRINFLFDKSFEPYMSATELCTRIGVSQATATNKARDIEYLLDIGPIPTEWYVPDMLKDSPLPWLISLNGLIVDARMMPREIQEEAYRLGLIPALP